MTATMTETETVNIATLLRGRVYVYKGTTFERGVQVVVGEELATDLEDMFDEVRDSDNEIIEKPLFSVEFDVPRPAPLAPPPSRRRRVVAANVRNGTAAPVADEAEDAPVLDVPRPGRIRRPRGSASRA